MNELRKQFNTVYAMVSEKLYHSNDDCRKAIVDATAKIMQAQIISDTILNIDIEGFIQEDVFEDNADDEILE